MTTEPVRKSIVDALRRDLIGPAPDDADLFNEVLKENPSRWYLSGFLAPAPDGEGEGTEAVEDEGDPLFGDEEAADPESGGGRSADDTPDDSPAPIKTRAPSSCGLTVLVDASVADVEVTLSWGDYVTIPPLPPEVLMDEDAQFSPIYRNVQWERKPGSETLRIPVPKDGRGPAVRVPNSGGRQRHAGSLWIEAHARPYSINEPDGTVRQLHALTLLVVNRRDHTRRRFQDVTYAFQVRLKVRSEAGLYPRSDRTGYEAGDPDAALSDLHYRDVVEYAVGCNTSAGWQPDEDGLVRAAHTDFLPQAEVERVEPNEKIADVEFEMEALAQLSDNPARLVARLEQLPVQYEVWIAAQDANTAGIPGLSRQATAKRLIAAARTARDRIKAGIQLVGADKHALLAFKAMNEAVARAARQRDAGPSGDPSMQRKPKWRPFQLAFILLNLSGLQDELHADRETVDLLFFPTGGGKTEAYLGLAAWTIAHRRLTHSGVLGAGVAVLMRYTLRLLTLDQLSRAAGVVCALELMRDEPGWREGDKRLLGDWPIEIGLWVGSAASPNRLGKTGDGRNDTAVARVRRYRKDGREAPAPIKLCPWCGTPFSRDSFACVPTAQAPRNMEIRCTNSACAFTGDRSLPILTVDEVIYRRLPAFIIATVDKFAGLPWLAEAGAFFGHVDRTDQWGFYGAADAHGTGNRLHNNASLRPPELIIQDELHLISGPLGTIAALYEVALDRLATRQRGEHRVRPKVVASTATVRRASAQIEALFDRHRTEIFPPPGPNRRDSFFAVTVPPDQKPARLYVGLASPGKGPKLIFLRALTTLLAAAQKEAGGGADADPYMTALCYFNALRELGGARRIVEDEVRARLGTYGTERRRNQPNDQPFADRRLRDVLELTSRESTDKVAAAKDALAKLCADPKDGVDVALATNMISVGLDITRLGLMVVQGQPKSASEYIQATSRVGRLAEKPGLVLVLLNAHKPRDRLHYEGFRYFHSCFYRAVEATSVTPWAARAMDRALAAVVVSAARHLFPDLSPEPAAADIASIGAARAEVVRTILDRAPAGSVVGGHAALTAAIDSLLDDWSALGNDRLANAERLYYGYPKDKSLLHDPLDPLLATIDPRHQRFTAGRSMRDVEHVSVLKITDPYGQFLN